MPFAEQWKQANLDENFVEAKKLLTLACQLAQIDPAAPLALTTDASLYSIGAVLEQYTDGVWQPLGFWSRQLKPSESKWNTFKHELYAVQQGLRHFLTEGEGHHIIMYSDHKPLIGAFKAKDPMPHNPIARNHILEILNFTSDIQFLAGKQNAVADFLSRPPDVKLGDAYRLPNSDDTNGSIAAVTDDVILNTVSRHQIAEAQMHCPDVAAHKHGQQAAGLNMKVVQFIPGVDLYCDQPLGKKARPLAKSLRPQIIAMFHDLSHPGKKETIKRIDDRFYWLEMRAQINDYVSKCHGCLSCKPHRIIMPSLNPNPVLAPRFSELVIDIVGPLPISQGNRFLLTIVDRTTRWIEALPMPEATALNCTNQFIRGWVRNFGLPSKATSDKGPSFISRLWSGIHAQLGTIISYSPLYSLQSVGGIERQHLDLKNSLKAALLKLGEDHQHNWMSILPWTLLARRTAFHADIAATPAELVLGTNPKLPRDLLHDPSPEDYQALATKLQQNANRPPGQTTLHGTVPTYMPPAVQSATHVYVSNQKQKTLDPRYHGPFPITKRLGTSCIQIKAGQDASGQDKFETHHWHNCHPVTLPDDTIDAQRPARGRKKLDPTAPAFSTESPPASQRADPLPSSHQYSLRPRAPHNYAE